MLAPVVYNTALSQSRRSVLDAWFDISQSQQDEKIMEGASVRYDAYPALWSDALPGLDIVEESLRIRK